MNDKLELRRQREAEIAELTREMTAGAAVFIPTVAPSSKKVIRREDVIVEDGAVLVDDIIDDDEVEDETLVEATDDISKYHRMDAISSSTSNSADVKNDIDAIANERKIPISHQVDLVGHTKAVISLSIEPTGNRLVTGSLDYNLKLYDFGGMDTRHRAFFSVEVEEGHPITAIAHSPSGDKFIVSTGSSQPRVFDREGHEIIKFVKGDMYLRDLANTKGHVMEVTGVQWHPLDKNLLLTSSLDGTMRLWDLTGEATFGCLINKHVLKIKTPPGVPRVGCTSCTFTPNGTKLIGGCSDATLHLWLAKTGKQLYSRADAVLSLPDTCRGAVTALCVSRDNSTLATRSETGGIALCDISKLQPVVFRVITGTNNTYPYANVDLSPDGALLCCGTSPAKEPHAKAQLLFFDTTGERNPLKKPVTPISADAAFMKIGVVAGASIIAVKWQPNTKQIFCSTSAGTIRVLFDPRFSVKGAMISAAKAPKREKDPTDFALIGDIITPNALPLFRDPEKNAGKAKYLERKDPVKSKMPAKNESTGPSKAPNNSFFFTKYVSEGRAVDNLRAEDPREALLKLDAISKSDPVFLGPAYQASQPKTQLHSLTFEQEQEEFRKKQKLE